MSEHLDLLVQRYPRLSACVQEIEDVFEAMRACFASGGKLLLCGNGGSAADAEHMAAELLKSFESPRPLTQELRRELGADLADQLDGALPAIPLPSFGAFNSAFLNDRDGTYGFAQLTLALGRPGDALLCISTSGNSRNVVHAATVARAIGMRTLALTGRTGGELVDLVDVCVRTPETDVAAVQELHLPIYHTLCRMLETDFFGSSREQSVVASERVV